MKLFEKFKWTDKPELKREQALIIATVIAFAIGFFKLRPYFEESTTVVVQSEHNEPIKPPKSILANMGLVNASHSKESTALAYESNFSKGTASNSGRNVKAVIERPLFDGLEVTLRGVLLNSISSLATENPAEVRVTGIIPSDLTQGMDDSEVRGAQLKGVVTPNNNKKLLNITFSQITTTEGRNFQINGYAFDLETKALGIAAEYSSGLPRRLLGAILDRGLVAGDQIGMAKLMTGVSGNNPGMASVQMAAMESNQEASSEISKEATKDLRGTQPELNVAAGTPITIKINALQGGEK